MSGFLFKGVCYPSQVDARQAACSEYPLQWASGTSVYSLSCAPAVDLTAPLMSMCRQSDGGSCAITSQPWPSMADCNFAGASDLVLDWGGVSMVLLVTVYAGKRLIALFDTHHTPD